MGKTITVTLTDKQFNYLMHAAGRGEDEWAAELEDFDNYGDGPSSPEDAEAIERILSQLEALQQATGILAKAWKKA